MLCSATDPVAGDKRTRTVATTAAPTVATRIAPTPFVLPGSPLKAQVQPKSVRTTLSGLQNDKKGGAQSIEVLLRGKKPTTAYTSAKGTPGSH